MKGPRQQPGAATGEENRLLQTHPAADPPDLRSQTGDGEDRALLERLAAWDGEHSLDPAEASPARPVLYEIDRAAMADELGADYFDTLLSTRVLDDALPRLVPIPARRGGTTAPRVAAHVEGALHLLPAD